MGGSYSVCYENNNRFSEKRTIACFGRLIDNRLMFSDRDRRLLRLLNELMECSAPLQQQMGLEEARDRIAIS
ncbi:hypothetical protein PCCS19_58530 [Paenibacillus sp. CCS19]|nr:hypothetical protein PCCS19_58530 [Paenibacillus cellulosilyticus]